MSDAAETRALDPFQHVAVEWLAARDRALLAYEPGLGKTVIGVTAADVVRAQRVLVVCPPSALAVWQAHFREWSPQRNPRIIHTKDRCRQDGGEETAIIGYSLASIEDHPAWRSAGRLTWDLVILDEAHHLRNLSAARTKQIYGKNALGVGKALVARSQKVWGLTGTPVVNHCHELFSHMRALAPWTLEHGVDGSLVENHPMNMHQFQLRYCKLKQGYRGYTVVGHNPKTAAELRERLDGFMAVETKARVYDQLPPIRWGVIPLARDQVEMTDELRTALENSEAATKGLEGDELLDWLASYGSSVATERRILGVAKAPLAAQFILDEQAIEPARKVIVFAQHLHVLTLLCEAFETAGYQTARIDGSVSQKQRGEIVEAFQNDPALTFVVAQLDAASESITLTASSTVFFVESSWTPTRNYQAASRAHRRGQTNKVLARFLTLDATLDNTIARALRAKMASIQAVTGTSAA